MRIIKGHVDRQTQYLCEVVRNESNGHRVGERHGDVQHIQIIGTAGQPCVLGKFNGDVRRTVEEAVHAGSRDLTQCVVGAIRISPRQV